VMKPALDPQRKAHRSASSAGSPKRPAGIWLRMRALASTCGVAALFSKNTEAGVLIEAIRAAVPELQALEAARLPPRQQEVLGLLAEGLTNKEIALRLGISPATVKIHVARVTSWLGAVNRTDAVARAQRGRLI